MSDKAIGTCFYVFGALLLMPAFAGIFIDSALVDTLCNRYCWAYTLIADLFGTRVSKIANGFIWLTMAALCFYSGYKSRHQADATQKLKAK